MSKTIEELEKELEGKHHLSKEAKEIKAKIEKLKEGEETKTPQEKVKEKVKAKKEEVEKGFKVDPKKNYVFQLKKGNKGGYTIPKEATVWDEDAQKLRLIRYSRVYESPFVEDQDENTVAERQEINFKRGRLVVSGQNKALINYLLVFDGNAEKKTVNPSNRRFKGDYVLVDEGVSIKESRKRREDVLKAMNIVSDNSTEAIVSFLRSEFRFNPGGLDQDYFEDSLYDKALSFAQSHPEKFILDFNNPRHKVKASIQLGFEQAILDLEKNDSVVWKDTRGVIHKGDPKKRADEVLTVWVLAEEEGKKFLKELEQKLK